MTNHRSSGWLCGGNAEAGRLSAKVFVKSELARAEWFGSLARAAAKLRSGEMTRKQKEWIDNASYSELLNYSGSPLWNDPLFKEGDVRDYYEKALKEKKPS